MTHLKAHLSGCIAYGTYTNSDVVSYQVIEEKAEPVDVLLRVVRENAAEKLRLRLAADGSAKAERDLRNAALEISELQRLKAKYPDA